MGITQFIAQHVLDFFDAVGYLSVFILMAMESMVFPVPSEAVLPPAGLLIAQGKFDLSLVILFAVLGSLFGSLLSYWIGRYGGKPFIDKFGKYFLLNQEDLEFSENFFKKYGEITIFICRFIPIVRHLISIPAGLAKMNYFKFSLYTVFGAAIWNVLLILVGVKWGKVGWEVIIKHSENVDLVAAGLLLVLGGGWLVYKRRKKKKRGNG